MNIAVFVILMLILTTTLGVVAVKQQFADVMQGNVRKVSYFSLPNDINCINPKEETKSVELLKKLLEITVLIFVSVHISLNVSFYRECIKKSAFFFFIYVFVTKVLSHTHNISSAVHHLIIKKVAIQTKYIIFSDEKSARSVV
jgi:hypothetical protein